MTAGTAIELTPRLTLGAIEAELRAADVSIHWSNT